MQPALAMWQILVGSTNTRMTQALLLRKSQLVRSANSQLNIVELANNIWGLTFDSTVGWDIGHVHIHGSASIQIPTPSSTPILCGCILWEAARDPSSICVATIHVGDPDWGPSLWLWSDPVPAGAGVGGVDQWMERSFYSSVCFSNKDNNNKIKDLSFLGKLRRKKERVCRDMDKKSCGQDWSHGICLETGEDSQRGWWAGPLTQENFTAETEAFQEWTEHPQRQAAKHVDLRVRVRGILIHLCKSLHLGCSLVLEDKANKG